MTSGSRSNTSSAGARDPSALKRVDEGELIDNGSARRVDQERGGLHQRELARSDLATSFRPKRRVDRNEVGSPQQFVERGEADARSRSTSGGLRRGDQYRTFIWKPRARRATAVPMRPPPPIKPKVLPKTPPPRRWFDCPPGNTPRRTSLSPSMMRRATAIIRPKQRSAVASVTRGGAVVTTTPRRVASSISMSVRRDGHRCDRQKIGVRRDDRSIDLVVHERQ